MAQQASFLKLKEQIEAAKRGLTEMSTAETAHNSNNLPIVGLSRDFADLASPKIAETEVIDPNLSDVSHNGKISTEFVDGAEELVQPEKEKGDPPAGSEDRGWSGDFQFFHRSKQPKSNVGLQSDNPLEDPSKDGSRAEALLFEKLDRRLAVLEGDIAQNRKYVIELINLLSRLDLRQETENKKARPSQRLNRRYMFWFLMSFLALGWFSLTPSGHTAIQYFLAFI